MKRIPWITLSISVVAVLIQNLDRPARAALEWRSDLFASGEVWRVISGHLCHWTGSHLFWDLAVFAVIGWRLERRARGRFLGTLGLTALVTDPLLRWTAVFESYRGLSGFAVALFALALLELCEAGWRKRDRVMGFGGAVGFLGLAGKLSFEVASGETLFVDSGAFAVAAEAHLAGLVAAVTSWGLARRGNTGQRRGAKLPLDNIPTGRF